MGPNAPLQPTAAYHAELEKCACPCGGEEFEITIGVSLFEDSEDVRWLYLGCRCQTLFDEDGRAEIVLVPMLYGLSWAMGNEYDRAGGMTRFVSHLDIEEIGALGASGMGVGHQDFCVHSQDGGNFPPGSRRVESLL
jgi:hypothetical protein